MLNLLRGQNVLNQELRLLAWFKKNQGILGDFMTQKNWNLACVEFTSRAKRAESRTASAFLV